MNPAVAHADASLQRLLGGENTAHVVGQPVVGEIGGDVGQRPAVVTRYQVEHCGDRTREAADREIAVEENNRDLGAVEQVAQVGIGMVQLVDLGVQLLR